MYQPQDATVQTIPLSQPASPPLTIVPEGPASTALPQPADSHRTVSALSVAAKTEVNPQPPIWLKLLQSKGKAASMAMAQQLKVSWDQIDFSQPQWTQLAIAILLISLPTGVSLAAFRVLATPPQPRCDQPQRFRADLAELQCLRRAMQSHEPNTLLRSLQQLQNWSSDSPVYSVSQRLLEDWSVVALSMAHEEFEAGHWETAARLAAAIPPSLELGGQVQERLGLWQAVRKQGEKAHALALEALDQQDWQTARDHAQTLANLGNDYWRRQGIQTLPEKIELARQAQQPSGEEAAELSAAAAGLSLPSPEQGQRHSQPAIPGRSRFAMPLISLKELTVGEPSQTGPEFSVTA